MERLTDNFYDSYKAWLGARGIVVGSCLSISRDEYQTIRFLRIG